jgi:peroxiredoxin
MIRPGFRFAGLCLFGMVAVVAAGCGKSDEGGYGKGQGKYSYNYGPPDMPAVAAQFHDDAPANRNVSPDKVPLTFLDLDGKKVDLASYRGKSNVVLVVTKGMPQSPGGVFCPGCLAQMNAMVANHAEFKKRDAEVLVVFPGPSEKAGEFLTNAKAREAEKPSPIPLLLDKDLVAVELLGIRGDLARPATYILDRKGNVVYAFVGEGTTDRPSVKALLAQLDKLKGKN